MQTAVIMQSGGQKLRIGAISADSLIKPRGAQVVIPDCRDFVTSSTLFVNVLKLKGGKIDAGKRSGF